MYNIPSVEEGHGFALGPSIHAEVLPFKESPISDRHTIALPTVLMCLIQGSRFGCAGIDSCIPPTKTDLKLARATWLGCRLFPGPGQVTHGITHGTPGIVRSANCSWQALITKHVSGSFFIIQLFSRFIIYGDWHSGERSHVYLHLFVPHQKPPSPWTRDKQFVKYLE